MVEVHFFLIHPSVDGLVGNDESGSMGAYVVSSGWSHLGEFGSLQGSAQP
jgi:putative alpha-1,2-mannosidase